MLCAVDTETYEQKDGIYYPILDTTKFVAGCIYKQNGTHKIYYDKQQFWEYILNLAQTETERNKHLTIYSHNQQYDFSAYVPITDPNIEIINVQPFIANYKINGKEAIKFLDTFPLFRMTLEKASQLIGLPKKEMPEKITSPTQLTDYLLRDTHIVLKLIQHLRQKLTTLNYKPRRLYTINQIAINYLMHTLPREKYLFRNKYQFHYTNNKKHIHEAYRGGMVRAYQTGTYNNTTQLDINSSYTYSATMIPFPDLRTETNLKNPTQNYSQKELLQYPGIHTTIITNQKNKYSPLQVRIQNDTNYHPSPGSIILGTYTNLELQTYIKNGYKILEIPESTIYLKAPDNPLSPILQHLYIKKQNTTDSFERYLYKQLMNSCFGKLAQTTTSQTYHYDLIDNAPTLFQQGYQAINRQGDKYLYQKTETYIKYKPYYAPIISALINAQAKINLYEYIQNIPLKDLLYTDTDSFLFKNNHINKFKINDQLGSLKIEHQNQQAQIYGPKTYRIGTNIKVSGIHKKDLNIKDFQQGTIKSTKMTTILTAQPSQNIGTPNQITRDLIQQEQSLQEREYKLSKHKIYIDAQQKTYIKNLINHTTEDIKIWQT